jgi:hypothetical protein
MFRRFGSARAALGLTHGGAHARAAAAARTVGPWRWVRVAVNLTAHATCLPAGLFMRTGRVVSAAGPSRARASAGLCRTCERHYITGIPCDAVRRAAQHAHVAASRLGRPRPVPTMRWAAVRPPVERSRARGRHGAVPPPAALRRTMNEYCAERYGTRASSAARLRMAASTAGGRAGERAVPFDGTVLLEVPNHA